MHSWVKKGITEKLQRPAENHSGIVSGLKPSNEQCVFADSMGILEEEKYIDKNNLNNVKMWWLQNKDIYAGYVTWEIGLSGKKE